MNRDALIFAISGTFFGLLVGWILGSQAPGRAVPAPPAAQTAAAPTDGAAPGARQPPPLDLQRAAELERRASAQATDAAVRIELGNLYYDAERFDLAVPWYEAALKLQPANVDVSTDLAICYYYTNDADKALKQLDHSLTVDSGHLKALLNQGIIRAFGKQDLAGAEKSWQRVVDLAPSSEEARRAQAGLDGLRSAHPAPGTPGAGSGGDRP